MPGKILRIMVPISCIFIFTFLFLFLLDHFDFGFIHQNLSGEEKEINHISSLHNASIIILTFIIACIAWYQLKGIINTGQAEFLLEIDKRFGDSQILEARKIIHLIYCESRRNNHTFTEPQHCEYIARKINELGNSTSESESIQYVYLLNFMNFLETISLFTNKGHISIDEINDLMNQSLDFFYTIFQLRINERRRKYKDNSFYWELEKLVKKLRCRKNRKCCFCYKCFFNNH